jgi:hypothetical protein
VVRLRSLIRTKRAEKFAKACRNSLLKGEFFVRIRQLQGSDAVMHRVLMLLAAFVLVFFSAGCDR